MSFLQKIAAAYNSEGRVPASLSLTGSATWTAGSLQESGSLIEIITADGSTLENWTFPTVSHTEVQGPVDLLGSARTCDFTDGKNKKHAVVGRNCFQAMPWFHPAFVLSKPYAEATSVAEVTTENESAQGLVKLSYTLSLLQAAGLPTAYLKMLPNLQKDAIVNVFYSAQTALPSRMEYRQAVDSDDSTSLDVAVTFADYSNEGGFMVPHHIQRFLQRTLVLDFIVTSVSI